MNDAASLKLMLDLDRIAASELLHGVGERAHRGDAQAAPAAVERHHQVMHQHFDAASSGDGRL